MKIKDSCVSVNGLCESVFVYQSIVSLYQSMVSANQPIVSLYQVKVSVPSRYDTGQKFTNFGSEICSDAFGSVL